MKESVNLNLNNKFLINRLRNLDLQLHPLIFEHLKIFVYQNGLGFKQLNQFIQIYEKVYDSFFKKYAFKKFKNFPKQKSL